MQLIELDDYNIYIGEVWQPLSELLRMRAYSQHLVLVDENTGAHCLPHLQRQLSSIDWKVIKIQAGELHKNIETCQFIWQQMMDLGVNRNAVLLNLGGGVIGDMGGFCAGTFKRGIDFIQVPTTLLSQVDASIGGKLGIDFMQVKNSIGLFCNPQGVFIVPEFLKTLPAREVRSGFAEIIKHALIHDAEQWAHLQRIEALAAVDWTEYLPISLAVKKHIVQEDPFEKGIRKALNFGHTIGHAIEGWALETDKPLLHGEAIAIGMICEAWLSHKILNLPLEQVHEIGRFIKRIYDGYDLPKTAYPTFIQLMKKDKKNELAEINFSLIQPIGNAVINQSAEANLILESLDFYTTHYA